MNQLNEIINQIRLKYAPDKRVAIFNVTAEELQGGSFRLKGETNNESARQELMSKLSELKYEISGNILLLPSADLTGKNYAVVNVSVANLRTAPEHHAEMATQSLLGFPVKVFQKSHGWYQVQTNDGYIAWVDGDGIALMNKKPFDDWNNSDKVIYTDFYGSSYSSADINSVPVSDIVKGALLKFISEENNFVKTEYPDGRTAYIPSSRCMKYTEWLKGIKLNEEALIATAKSFMGIPYLWGGTSTKGVDCSGFTKSVYFFNGVQLPRDASQQVFTGDPVDTKDGFANLKPGDLLFFGTKASNGTKEKITHVAMYIGNNEYIHSSGRVRINSLDTEKENFSQHRFSTFIRAKRILTSLDKNGVVQLKPDRVLTGAANETK
ncbi:MAG: NlpC/P60 family protein [Syntrophothermus sp.]